MASLKIDQIIQLLTELKSSLECDNSKDNVRESVLNNDTLTEKLPLTKQIIPETIMEEFMERFEQSDEGELFGFSPLYSEFIKFCQDKKIKPNKEAFKNHLQVNENKYGKPTPFRGVDKWKFTRLE